MTWRCFDVEVADKVAHVRLNRPDELNSMVREFWNELPRIVRQPQGPPVDTDVTVRHVDDQPGLRPLREEIAPLPTDCCDDRFVCVDPR